MALQSIIRWLLPREDVFYDFLERQATTAHEGVKALQRLREPAVSAEAVREAVQELEHDGDKLVHELEEALAETFVTPMDREDLQDLSSELDTILDFTNGAARVFVLYGVERPTQAMLELTDLLEKCTAVLATAMPKLRRHMYPEIIEASRDVKKLEKDADAVFRNAVSALFKDPAIDAKVILREREVLDHIEEAIDHCDRVGKTLKYLSVKHG
jgi:uncharacterized protein Yka (UPF0111/DUF47 family)